MQKLQIIGLGSGLLLATLFVVVAGWLTQPKPAEARTEITYGQLKLCYHDCGNDHDCLARCLAKN